MAFITSSNDAGHEKTISGRERITERRLVIFTATLLYNYSNILLFKDARDVNATPLMVSPRTASRPDSVHGLSIRVIESVPTH